MIFSRVRFEPTQDCEACSRLVFSISIFYAARPLEGFILKVCYRRRKNSSINTRIKNNIKYSIRNKMTLMKVGDQFLLFLQVGHTAFIIIAVKLVFLHDRQVYLRWQS